MSRLAALLLIPPVNARLSARYHLYRSHGASAFSAALGCLWTLLAWLLIPLEHPRWQQLRNFIPIFAPSGRVPSIRPATCCKLSGC